MANPLKPDVFCFICSLQSGVVITIVIFMALYITLIFITVYDLILTSNYSNTSIAAHSILLVHTLILLTGVVMAFAGAFKVEFKLMYWAGALVAIATCIYFAATIVSYIPAVYKYACPGDRCPDHVWLQNSLWRYNYFHKRGNGSKSECDDLSTDPPEKGRTRPGTGQGDTTKSPDTTANAQGGTTIGNNVTGNGQDGSTATDRYNYSTTEVLNGDSTTVHPDVNSTKVHRDGGSTERARALHYGPILPRTHNATTESKPTRSTTTQSTPMTVTCVIDSDIENNDKKNSGRTYNSGFIRDNPTRRPNLVLIIARTTSTKGTSHTTAGTSNITEGTSNTTEGTSNTTEGTSNTTESTTRTNEGTFHTKGARDELEISGSRKKKFISGKELMKYSKERVLFNFAKNNLVLRRDRASFRLLNQEVESTLAIKSTTTKPTETTKTSTTTECIRPYTNDDRIRHALLGLIFSVIFNLIYLVFLIYVIIIYINFGNELKIAEMVK